MPRLVVSEHIRPMRRRALLLTLLAGCAANRRPLPAPTWAPLFGFHAGPPANYSAALGEAAVVARQLDDVNPRAHDDRDVFALAEPGWKAARASIGYGVEHDRLRSVTLMNVRASALRRWGDGATRDFLGVEFSAQTIEELSLGARVGLFRQVDGRPARQRFLFSFDYPVGW